MTFSFSEVQTVVESNDTDLVESYLFAAMCEVLDKQFRGQDGNSKDTETATVVANDKIIPNITNTFKYILLHFDMYEVWQMDKSTYIVRIRSSYRDTLPIKHPDSKFGRVVVGVKFDAKVSRSGTDMEYSVIPTIAETI